jgi:MraZ protein
MGCIGADVQALTMSLPSRILYTGTFRHNLDDKGRLTIPSAWRSAHGDEDQFLATPNPDGYVSVLPPAEIAAFFSLAQAFTFDKQGRVALSDALLEHAKITKEAVLGGSLTKFNIYSPERWALVEQRPGAGSAAGFLRRYQI